MSFDRFTKAHKINKPKHLVNNNNLNSNLDMFSDVLLLDTIMNNSQDTIYFKDKNSKFVFNSKAHAIQFGFENPKNLFGKSDFDFFSKEFAQEAFEDELRIMETGKPILGKVEKWDLKDGCVKWFSASKYPIYGMDGQVLGTWGTSRDITSLKLAEEELVRLNTELELANQKLHKISNIDGLSELYNQRRFYEVLEETIALYHNKREQGNDSTFCVIQIDIDCFKIINDTYGHLVGDRAIKYVAELIRENTRELDTCYRCGGDEFAIILLDTDIHIGINIAEDLRKIIEKSSFQFNDREYKLTVSLGIMDYQDEQDISKLLLKVDNKLYISKRQGKNQVN